MSKVKKVVWKTCTWIQLILLTKIFHGMESFYKISTLTPVIMFLLAYLIT